MHFANIGAPPHDSANNICSNIEVNVTAQDENIPSISNSSVIMSDDIPMRECSQMELNDSYFENYSKIFDTAYMRGAVAFHAKNQASEFSIRNLLRELRIEPACKCCLCKVQFKHNDSLKYCIKKHPVGVCCTRGQSKKRNNQKMYMLQNVCEECLESMTLNTKRSKDKHFHCTFDSCSREFKSIPHLRTHYMKHLKVQNYICPICCMEFSSKSSVKSHQRKH